MDQGQVFDQRTADDLVAMVREWRQQGRRFEGARAGGRAASSNFRGPESPIVNLVTVTSATPDSDYSPLQVFPCRVQTLVYGCNTTIASSISTGSQTVTPASMVGIFKGANLLIDTVGSGLQEIVTVTAATSTTFTATFANTHSGGVAICGSYTPTFAEARVNAWDNSARAKGDVFQARIAQVRATDGMVLYSAIPPVVIPPPPVWVKITDATPVYDGSFAAPTGSTSSGGSLPATQYPAWGASYNYWIAATLDDGTVRLSTMAGPLAVTYGNQTLALSWSAPSDLGGASITGYTIWRQFAGGGDAQIYQVDSVDASTTTYSDVHVSTTPSFWPFFYAAKISTLGLDGTWTDGANVLWTDADGNNPALGERYPSLPNGAWNQWTTELGSGAWPLYVGRSPEQMTFSSAQNGSATSAYYGPGQIGSGDPTDVSGNPGCTICYLPDLPPGTYSIQCDVLAQSCVLWSPGSGGVIYADIGVSMGGSASLGPWATQSQMNMIQAVVQPGTEGEFAPQYIEQYVCQSLTLWPGGEPEPRLQSQFGGNLTVALSGGGSIYITFGLSGGEVGGVSAYTNDTNWGAGVQGYLTATRIHS